jgi:hypothetical protein
VNKTFSILFYIKLPFSYKHYPATIYIDLSQSQLRLSGYESLYMWQRLPWSRRRASQVSPRPSDAFHRRPLLVQELKLEPSQLSSLVRSQRLPLWFSKHPSLTLPSFLTHPKSILRLHQHASSSSAGKFPWLNFIYFSTNKSRVDRGVHDQYHGAC